MREQLEVDSTLSIARGIPLAAEEGIGPLTLGAYLREIVARYGDGEAAVMREGDTVERWSYRDLGARSEQVARALLACGVGPGTRVGILMTNRLEFLSAVFGTALAGGVATTMNTFSTVPELDVLLQQSGCSVLLLERHVLKKDFFAMLTELEPQVATAAPCRLFSERFPHLRHLAMVDNDGAAGAVQGWQQFLERGRDIASGLLAASEVSVTPADPAVLFFSSGSTGKPKGILSAHRGVCLQLWRWCKWWGLREGDRSWSANGFFWSGNFAIGIGGTLSAGASLILQKTFQPEEALRLMEAERATFMFAWPHQWAQLTDAPNWLEVDLSSLKLVEATSPIAAHPSITTDYREPASAYGNTETFTLVTVYPANTPEQVSRGSHGLPMAGNTLKIVNPLSGVILPLGERGEIAVKSPTMMLGYLGIPLDETLDEDGFLRTQDGGYLDSEGRLYWEGRLNDIIKTGGANVSPLEIDAVIAKCPGVKVAKTVGIPDELLGELVVSCIVCMAGIELDERTVREFAKQQLASYKVPRRVVFFEEAELELTGSAKIKSSELRQLATKRMQEEFES